MLYMKLKRISLTALCLSALVFAGCSSDDNKDEPVGIDTTVKSPAAFNSVVTGMTSFTTKDATYRIQFYENNKADIYIGNLALTANGTPKTYILKGVKYAYSNAAGISNYVIEGANAKADDGTSFTDINVLYQDGHVINNDIYKRLSINFENGSSEITMIPNDVLCIGKTVTTNAKLGAVHTSDKMVYRFSITPGKNTLDMFVTNADFAEGMPALGEMKFADVHFSYTDDGFTCQEASLIPSIADVPQPKRIVTDLNGDIELDSTSDVTFNCMGIFSVKATLTAGYYK